LNERISEKSEGIKRIEIQKSMIKIDEKLLSNREKIFELQKGQDKYISAVRDLPMREEELKRDKEGLKVSLHEIGDDWDEEKLSKFDISIPTKETVRKKHNTLEEARENIRDTEKEVQGIEQKDIKNIEEEIADVDKRLKTQSLQQIDEQELEQQGRSQARQPTSSRLLRGETRTRKVHPFFPSTTGSVIPAPGARTAPRSAP